MGRRGQVTDLHLAGLQIFDLLAKQRSPEISGVKFVTTVVDLTGPQENLGAGKNKLINETDGIRTRTFCRDRAVL